ncbi:transporter [Phenylobacterium montanum]|uniref:Transporter n=1 Tax=Phenylobacterium montanum TaxID=2823693 RepID=A0A975IU87_9CAUL|nr:transporter [Caulobacter sp. S6]QUD87543.1 transporter [Caulobacter sp. S6]
MTAVLAAFALLTLTPGAARADAPTDKQSLDDAWWTGPLLAPSAGTLPKGHVLIEPYLYDALPYAHVDGRGAEHSLPHQNDFGSLTYINYGLADRFTVGVIPRFGYVQEGTGRNSSGIGVGDLSLQAQYQLTQFHAGSWMPTLSVNVQETLPTGRYDRLKKANDGFGAGAHTTTLSLYAQTYFWTPNGRVLRTRLDLSYATSDGVRVRDLSVYGTTAGFRGHAQPGDSVFGDLAFEYSATSNWVLALDIWGEQDGRTRIAGAYPGSSPVRSVTPVGRALYLAPAVEYNFNSRVGLIAGARVLAAGRNETAAVVPVAALNMVF